MTQEFLLGCTNVVPRLQEVGRERVTEGVTARSLSDLTLANRGAIARCIALSRRRWRRRSPVARSTCSRRAGKTTATPTPAEPPDTCDREHPANRPRPRQPRTIDDMAMQELECRERLCLRGGGQFALDRQVCKKRQDLALAHVTRVTESVVAHEPIGPT